MDLRDELDHLNLDEKAFEFVLKLTTSLHELGLSNEALAATNSTLEITNQKLTFELAHLRRMRLAPGRKPSVLNSVRSSKKILHKISRRWNLHWKLQRLFLPVSPAAVPAVSRCLSICPVLMCAMRLNQTSARIASQR